MGLATRVIPGVHLLLLGAPSPERSWPLGHVSSLDPGESSFTGQLNEAVRRSASEWLLVWPAASAVPDARALERLLGCGAELMHGGLSTDAAGVFPDVEKVLHDWSVINAPAEGASTCWRLAIECCLLNRRAFERVGALDPVFRSARAAGIDLGLRALRAGAIVEHRPELRPDSPISLPKPATRDLYVLVDRHFGSGWSTYLSVRRILTGRSPIDEMRARREARDEGSAQPAPAPQRGVTGLDETAGCGTAPAVSVIVPTLGRYPYLARGLDSLRQSSVAPAEIIVVDQNAERQPGFYEEFADLPLRVIWLQERGQSLARNAGLAQARGVFVLMFDDDSLAAPDLIEKHLAALGDGRFHVSTGVSFPPPPEAYELPPAFQYPRLAQTLDTGNCLLPLELARRVGGLDRSYDRGPGADMDFGTRLYLSGARLLHNPAARRIHFKAPNGGLRVHGAHKYNTDSSLLAPFPPVTQSYYNLRYLSPRQSRERVFLQFVTSKLPRGVREGRAGAPPKTLAIAKLLAVLPLLPAKHMLSRRAAQRLLRHGPRTAPELACV